MDRIIQHVLAVKYRFTLIVALWLMTVGVTPIVAQTPSPPPTAPTNELAVLILVDQSESMDKSDPQALRLQSLRYILATLGEYRSALPPGSVIRFSVIYFGSTTQSIIDWTPLRVNEATWDRDLNLLQQKITDGIGRVRRNWTDINSGVNLAVDAFKKLPNPNARKAMILFTDGVPCVSTLSDPGCLRAAGAIAEMEKIINTASRMLQDVVFYVIALDQENQHWGYYSPYWVRAVRVSERAIKLDQALQIGPTFLTILAGLVTSLDAEGELAVPIDFSGSQTVTKPIPPYHQQLRLTLFKTGSTAGLKITDPKGRLFDANSPNVQVLRAETSIETWVISNPTPGSWTFQIEETTRLTAFADLIPININATIDSSATQLRPAKIKVTLSDNLGNPLPDYTDPLYALDLTATVIAPDGQTLVFKLLKNGTGVYTGEFTPPLGGNYQLGLNGVTKNPDGSAFQIIKNPTVMTFTVKGLSVTVTGFPTKDIYVSQSITLSGQINDGDTVQPITGVEWKAEVKNQTGKIWTTFELIPDPKNPNTVVGKVDMTEEGQYVITVKANRGTSTLGSQTSEFFAVRPVTIIKWNWESPLDNATHYTTQPVLAIPFFQPLSLTVAVSSVTASNNKPIDIRTIRDSNAAPPIRLEIWDDKDKPVPSQGIFRLLDPVTRSDRHTLLLLDLPEGKYRFRIAVNDGQLNESYLYDPRTFDQSRTLIVTTNPLVYAIYGMFAVVLVLSVTGGVIAVRTDLARRKHPAQGVLNITFEAFLDGREIQIGKTIKLKKRNYQVFGKQFFPRVTQIKKIVVKCPTQDMSDAGLIEVEVKTQDRVFLGKLGSEERLPLHSDKDGSYYLGKDYIP
jgi:hypothetical protein